jgi:hypothetical protein
MTPNIEETKCIRQIMENNQVMVAQLNEFTKNQQTMATQISALMETLKQPQQSPQIKTATNFNLPLATLGARLQKINPDTFQIVRVYESIAECIKESGFKDKRPSITKAIEKNTVYNGYRWAFVGRDEDPNVVKPLAATKEIRPQTGGNVAKLDQDKQTIINVYIDRKTAAKMNGLVPSGLDTPIKNCKIVNGFYYMVYDNCDAQIIAKYEEINGAPMLYKNGMGMFDNDGNLVREFSCKYDCIKQMKISDKTLAKALDNNIQYNGYFYKTLGEKNQTTTG